jgi:hypothetical protein
MGGGEISELPHLVQVGGSRRQSCMLLGLHGLYEKKNNNPAVFWQFMPSLAILVPTEFTLRRRSIRRKESFLTFEKV